MWETSLGAPSVLDMVRSKVQLPALKPGQSAPRAMGDKPAINAVIASRRSGIAVDSEIVVTIRDPRSAIRETRDSTNSC